MKASEEIEVITTLVLNYEEAQWLRSVVQNPLTAHESDKDTAMRHAFFEALNPPRMAVPS
jgi:hypothetical protein